MLGFRVVLYSDGGAVLGGVSSGVMASKISMRLDFVRGLEKRVKQMGLQCEEIEVAERVRGKGLKEFGTNNGCGQEEDEAAQMMIR